MLFVRTYRGMLGGHLKVFDYLRHVAASGLYTPVLWVTDASTEMPPAELLPDDLRIVRAPIDADAYFVGGMNWEIFDGAGVTCAGKPVVNLLQGLRHGAPGDPRLAFLARPALRVCVSEAVERAVRETGVANGPVVAISNGIDLAAVAAFRADRARDRVFIAGAKDAPLAHAVASRLQVLGIETDLLVTLVERSEFLRRLGASRAAVLLPLDVEGFYLPALEAMALGATVVMPPCEGSASFCRDGETCAIAPRDANALARTAAALLADPARCERIARDARAMAARHSLERERAHFVEALRTYAASFA